MTKHMELWDEGLSLLMREGRKLANATLRDVIRTSETLRCRPHAKRKGREQRAVILSARKHLLLGAQLMDQILATLRNSHLLLALIGLRVLTEEAINAKYIFDHPKHPQDWERAYQLTQDLLNRSAQQYTLSKLDNKTIEHRAREVELQELYENEYTYLCQFAHGLVEGSYLYDPLPFKTLSISTIGNSIGHSQFIRECIGDFFSLPRNQRLEERSLSFGEDLQSYLTLIRKDTNEPQGIILPTLS